MVGANFCDECGSPTGGTEPQHEPATSQEDAVRKTVTVLFCDVVGSTAFGEAVDPEAAREAMARYHKMAQAVIDSHQGTVAKFIGDGVMAVFGIPRIEHDDASRAVAAGLELQRLFEPIAKHVLDRYGAHLGLRVGINTGVVVIADADADLIGDVINTAARIEAKCSPGRVLVGEETWRLTRSHIKYESLEGLEMKGKASPVSTYEVVGSSTPEEEATTPFVGRTGELAALRETFDRVVTERRASIATVIGSPGVGKTRLAAEFTSSVGHGALTFDLRVERSGAAAFAPVADLVRASAGIDTEQGPDDALVRIAQILGHDVADRDRLTSILGSFVGVSSSRPTEEMLFGARRLLEVLAATQPVILIVDDVQWAQPLFLDLLDHLAEWIADASVLIIALARPEIREVRPSLAESGRWVAIALTVEGLAAGDVERLAAQLLGVDDLPRELAERLPANSDGNPLFVRELVRMLVDDGAIRRTSEGWAMSIDVDALEVPPTIQSLLATRVERMPLDQRRLIELAAVVGTEFPKGAVAAIADEGLRQSLDELLEQLRRKEIVDSTGTYWGDEPVFRFHHVLIRDAAYRRLLKETRAVMHMRVGEWIEQSAEGLVGEYESVIAYHFEQAHHYRSQLGTTDVENGERAAALLRAAALSALDRDDLGSTSGLANRGLACLTTDSLARPDLMLVACEALLSSGDVQAGRVALGDLDAIAHDPRLKAWSTCFHGQLSNLSEPEALIHAAAEVDQAAEQLGSLGDHAGVAKARQVRAGTLARLGRIGDAEAELDLALIAARQAADRRRITEVLSSAPAAALWGPSPVSRAGGRCLDVIRLLRLTSGSLAVEANSVRCQAVLEALRGRYGSARSMLATAQGTAEELGLRQSLLETELYGGIVELLAGEPAEAEGHLRRAYEGLEGRGIAADAGHAAAYLARSLLLQGHLDQAAEFAAIAGALVGQNTRPLMVAQGVEAEILAARGDMATAVVRARQAVALASGRDIVFEHGSACAVLARVCDLAGDSVGAVAARADARRLFDAKGATAHEVPDEESAVAGARSDQLIAAVEPTQPTQPVLPALENAATRLGTRRARQLLTGDVDAVGSEMSPDYIVDDRRSVVGGGVYGLEAMEEIARIVGAEPAHLKIQTIAIRGDRLALVRAQFDLDGYEFDVLNLESLDSDGQHDRTVMFDVEDLSGAFDELNHLYGEGEGAPYLPALESLVALYSALNHQNAEAVAELVPVDLVVVDHRPMGWPEMNAAEFVRLITAPEAMGRGMTGVIEVIRMSPSAILSRSFTFVEHPDDLLSPMWQYFTMWTTVQGPRSDFYELGQLDLALARYDEVVAMDAPGAV